MSWIEYVAVDAAAPQGGVSKSVIQEFMLDRTRGAVGADAPVVKPPQVLPRCAPECAHPIERAISTPVRMVRRDQWHAERPRRGAGGEAHPKWACCMDESGLPRS